MHVRVVALAGTLLFLFGCNAQTSSPPPAPKPIATTASVGSAPDAVAKDVDAAKVAAEASVTPGAEKKDSATEPGTTPAAPTSPLNAAMELAGDGELAKALDLLRAAQKTDAESRDITLALTQFCLFHAAQKLQTENADAAAPLFLESAGHARRLIKDFGKLSEPEATLVSKAFYNEACVNARGGKADEAVKSLDDAVSQGFSDLEQLDGDDELKSLRDHDAFKTWRGEAEQKIAQRLQRIVQELLAANESFAFDFALNDYDGKPHKLTDLKEKIAIVDFWATWCGPCREEIPHLVELHQKYREQGLEVIGINYENEQGAEAAAVIKKFVTENGVTYPCLIGDDPTQEQVPNFEGFPTMLFVDRTGKVRLKMVGYTPHPMLETIVTTLLAEKAAP